MFSNTDKTQLELISTKDSWTGLEKKAGKNGLPRVHISCLRTALKRELVLGFTDLGVEIKLSFELEVQGNGCAVEVATVGLATVLPVHQLPAAPPVETVELGLESEDLVVVLGELLLVLRLMGLRLREVGLVLLLVAVEVLELGPEEWPELVESLVVESQLGLAQYLLPVAVLHVNVELELLHHVLDVLLALQHQPDVVGETGLDPEFT